MGNVEVRTGDRNLGRGKEGEGAMDKREPTKVAKLRKQAEAGDADAQYALGCKYYEGDGVERDYAEALQWYRKAAAQGSSSGLCDVGYCYRNGTGVKQDCAKAIPFYRKAADSGLPDGRVLARGRLRERPGREEESREGEALVRRLPRPRRLGRCGSSRAAGRQVTGEMMNLRLDCRHFRGDKPCRYACGSSAASGPRSGASEPGPERAEGGQAGPSTSSGPPATPSGCWTCSHYEPMGRRILIIKLDAIGDVARTTPILRALRKKYNPCHITWLVHPTAEEMLRGNPLINVLLPYRPKSLEPLRAQRFDSVFSLDKTPRATAVAAWANAPEKLGFGLSEFGTVYPLNPESEYAFAARVRTTS